MIAIDFGAQIIINKLLIRRPKSEPQWQSIRREHCHIHHQHSQRLERQRQREAERNSRKARFFQGTQKRTLGIGRILEVELKNWFLEGIRYGPYFFIHQRESKESWESLLKERTHRVCPSVFVLCLADHKPAFKFHVFTASHKEQGYFNAIILFVISGMPSFPQNQRSYRIARLGRSGSFQVTVGV